MLHVRKFWDGCRYVVDAGHPEGARRFYLVRDAHSGRLTFFRGDVPRPIVTAPKMLAVLDLLFDRALHEVGNLAVVKDSELLQLWSSKEIHASANTKVDTMRQHIGNIRNALRDRESDQNNQGCYRVVDRYVVGNTQGYRLLLDVKQCTFKEFEKYRAKQLAEVSSNAANGDPIAVDGKLSDSTTLGLTDVPRQPQSMVGDYHLGQLDKSFYGLDNSAQRFLDMLHSPTRIISVAVPAGFGKTALMVRVIQRALAPNDNVLQLNGPEEVRRSLLNDARLTGIAVVDAASVKPDMGLLPFTSAIQEVVGGRTVSFDDLDEKERGKRFHELLRSAGPFWLIIENAEHVFVQKTIRPELRFLLDEWCIGGHSCKLIILSRFAVPFPPPCHDSLLEVEQFLVKGLPVESAVILWDSSHKVSRFKEETKAEVKERIVERLHYMPIAIEAFAGYLNSQQSEIALLDIQFVNSNELLYLFQEGQRERFFVHIINEQLLLLDAVALLIFRTVVWADAPVPVMALSRIANGLGTSNSNALTMLERSNLLMRSEGGPRSNLYMHALIRAAAITVPKFASIPNSDLPEVALSLFASCAVSSEVGAGFDQVYSSGRLAERALRQLHSIDSHDEESELLGKTLVLLGCALANNGRLAESESALSEASNRFRDRVSSGQIEFQYELFSAILFLGTAVSNRGRLGEAEVLLKEAVSGLREIAESQPSSNLVRGRFAEALSSLGNALANQGKLEDALIVQREAVDRLESLIDMGDQSSRVLFARAATSLGATELNSGQLPDSLNSLVRALEQLTKLEESEQIAHKEEFAMVYMNLGGVLVAQGQFESALAFSEEAVRLLRTLVDEGRNDIKCHLAMAILNLDAALLSLGRAVSNSSQPGESARLFGRLFEEGRDDLRDKFALALANFGAGLIICGRYSEAESALDEAISHFRPLVSEGRADLVEKMALALVNIGVAYLDQNELEQGKMALEEAHWHLGSLVSDGRQDLEPLFAGAQMNLGAILLRLQLNDDAETVLLDAKGRFEQLIAGGMPQWEEKLATTIRNLGNVLILSGRLTEGELMLRDALSRFNKVQAQRHQGLELTISQTMSELGGTIADQGRYQEGSVILREAVARFHGMILNGRTELVALLAETLLKLGIVETNQGHFREAVAAHGEAAEVFESLTSHGHAQHEFMLSRALLGVATARAALGQFDQAAELFQGAIKRYERHVSCDRPDLEDQLMLVFANFGAVLVNLSRKTEAIGVVQNAIDGYRRLVGNGRADLMDQLAWAERTLHNVQNVPSSDEIC